jgi:uncharacterized protein
MTGADPFVVNVARLRRSARSARGSEPMHVERSGEVVLAGPLEASGIDPGRSVVPPGAEAEVDIVLRPFDGGIEASGTVRAPWVGTCRRCAEPVSGELAVEVRERFGEHRPDVVAPDDDELYPIVDEIVDLGPLVRDALVLELPMAPLCRDDCAGLCPVCGANRNEGDCGCVAPRDPRWANLDVLR